MGRVLQRSVKKPQDDNSDCHHTGNESEPPPLRDEIRQALNQLANGKSTGVDELPAELWKATGELGIDLLWTLYLIMGAARMAYRLVSCCFLADLQERE